MKVWRVYNGYVSNGPVHRIVLAETKERAREKALSAEDGWAVSIHVEPVEMLDGVEEEDYGC